MHLAYPAVLAALLFCTGLYGVLARRNAILVLMSVELMLNAVNLNLVAFDVWLARHPARRPGADPVHHRHRRRRDRHRPGDRPRWSTATAAPRTSTGSATPPRATTPTAPTDDARTADRRDGRRRLRPPRDHHDPRRPRPPPPLPRRRRRPAPGPHRPRLRPPPRRPADPRRARARRRSSPYARAAARPIERRHPSSPPPARSRSNSPCTSTASPPWSPSWSASSPSCVQIYSTGYLRDDPRYPSYAALVSLFTSAMLLVVYSGDLMVLLVGWEIMGICSYFLVGHYWETPEARAASLKAFLVTKLGDVPFLIGLFALAADAGSFRITGDPRHRRRRRPRPPDADRAAAPRGRGGQVGAVPAAHLAARRDGGPHPRLRADPRRDDGRRRCLLRRPSPPGLRGLRRPRWSSSPSWPPSRWSARRLAALAQDDIKRVLAYSTIGQLGYMTGALAVGDRGAAVFHLLVPRRVQGAALPRAPA